MQAWVEKVHATHDTSSSDIVDYTLRMQSNSPVNVADTTTDSVESDTSGTQSPTSEPQHGPSNKQDDSVIFLQEAEAGDFGCTSEFIKNPSTTLNYRADLNSEAHMRTLVLEHTTEEVNSAWLSRHERMVGNPLMAGTFGCEDTQQQIFDIFQHQYPTVTQRDREVIPAESTHDDKLRRRRVKLLCHVLLLALLAGAMITTFHAAKHPLQHAAIQLALLFTAAIGGGNACARAGIPPLCASLVVGVVMGNLNFLDEVTGDLQRILKGSAVALIMLRAGLSLQLREVYQRGVSVTILTVVPCAVEAAVVCVGTFFIFPHMGWAWATMLGFLVSDVSPAVTVPLLANFQKRGLGVDAGIPSVLLAAGSINSVVCIVGFEMSMQIAFADGKSVGVYILAPVVVVRFRIYRTPSDQNMSEDGNEINHTAKRQAGYVYSPVISSLNHIVIRSLSAVLYASFRGCRTVILLR
eukprot:m.1094007 g.1094007  ORF g.1094007 m.1094007 type:complete len:466 (+) comp24299_c0_seq25:139-1536(+)